MEGRKVECPIFRGKGFGGGGGRDADPLQLWRPEARGRAWLQVPGPPCRASPPGPRALASGASSRGTIGRLLQPGQGTCAQSPVSTGANGQGHQGPVGCLQLLNGRGGAAAAAARVATWLCGACRGRRGGRGVSV